MGQDSFGPAASYVAAERASAIGGHAMNVPQCDPPVMPLEILLVEDDIARAAIFDEGLGNTANVRRIGELSMQSVIMATDIHKADLLIISRHVPDGDMIRVVEELSGKRPMPIVVFVEADQGDLARRAIRAGASGYIVSGLEARKLIERAKGLLMEQRGVTEHAAYEALRKMAMSRGKPVREIAETIVAISNMLP